MGNWTAHIDAFGTHLLAAGMSPGTVKVRRSYLLRLAASFPDRLPGELSADDLACFLACPAWCAETRKSARAAVRSFYGWAVLTGRLDRSPAARLLSVRVPLGKPRPTPDGPLRTALAHAHPRERTMLLLAALAGLRCAEIARVHSRDVIGGTLRVSGKGGRVRLIPLHPLLLADLALLPAGYLFPGKDGGHLSPQWVSVVVSRLLGEGWSAHTLRHRFASQVFAVERDLISVQHLLGHASVTTTQIYVAAPDDALRTAVLGARLAA